MRNPLHYSAELLVKRAAPNPPQMLNIPKFNASNAEPAMNDTQIQQMMNNIQSYPEEQQQKILDSINQNFDQAQYRGGLVGGALGGLGNWASSGWNALQGGSNAVTDTLFGWKPFDTQDADRYRAQTVLQTAAKNPELYKKITQDVQNAGIGGQPAAQSAPVPAAQPTAQAPIPSPAASPAPGAATVAKPPIPSPQPAPAATPAQATPAAPRLISAAKPQAPASPMQAPVAQRSSWDSGLSPSERFSAMNQSAPALAKPPALSQAPTLSQPPPQPSTPWTDPRSKFNKNWSADQREQYIRAKYK